MDTGYLNMDSGQLSVKVENSSDKRGLIINIEEYRAKVERAAKVIGLPRVKIKLFSIY